MKFRKQINCTVKIHICEWEVFVRFAFLAWPCRAVTLSILMFHKRIVPICCHTLSVQTQVPMSFSQTAYYGYCFHKLTRLVNLLFHSSWPFYADSQYPENRTKLINIHYFLLWMHCGWHSKSHNWPDYYRSLDKS